MPNYKRKIRRAARREGVRPRLLVSQLQAESNLDPNAVSPAGAKGIAQFMPGTAASYGVNLNDGNPNDDIRGAARLMHDLLRQFGGDEKKALAAYNAGPGAVQKYGGVPPYAETRAYVSKILKAAGKGGGGGSMSAAQVGPAYTTSSRTVPGIDNGPLRQQLKLQYLSQSHDPNALLQLATGLRGAQDTPDRTVTTTRRVRSSNAASGAQKAHKSGDLYELFWQGPHGIDVKNGQRVAQGFVEGHTDHVHVAAGRKQVIRLGKLAQQMGLHVGENPAFGGVNPVHAEHSFHYRNEAIDVSGDPKAMAKFARRVARMYGV